MSIGFGYDIHALKKGRRLVLGGVRVPHPKGLDGHSDGDALLHALTDAVLGAMGEKDLGSWFPDTDARWKGADSRIFVDLARRLLKKRRLRVEHMDSTIVAEEPKLGPHMDRIKQGVAAAFGVCASHIGVKAKSNEGFGMIGKGGAIACFAVVSLKPC